MLTHWLKKHRYHKQTRQYKNSALTEFYCPPNLAFINEQTFVETDFFVLDFETTGLNPQTDRVLSAGWTTISNGRIQLGNSEHHYFQYTDTIPDKTVAIHHITEEEAANGKPINEIFPHLLQQLNGKVLVAHFADIETKFLQQIAYNVYGSRLPIQVVDTLQIAFHSTYKNAVHIPSNALNLFTLREEFGLPRYKAHNAMQDAVATAELLLLQVEMLGGIAKVNTKKLLTLS